MSKSPSPQLSAKLLAAFDLADQLAVQEEAHRSEVRAILEALFQAMDALDRLLAAPEGTSSPVEASWRSSLGLVLRQLEQALAKAGIVPLGRPGERIDPALHEIVEARPTRTAAEDEIILEVVRRGCMWHGELMRRPCVVAARYSMEGEQP